MSATTVGALLAAGALGVTHALEPDHVAGISSLTSQYGDSRLSALVGVCFSAGHVALVVAWVLVAYVLLGQTTFPDTFDTAGTLVVAVVLGVFGGLLAVRGYRAAARAHAQHHTHPSIGQASIDQGNIDGAGDDGGDDQQRSLKYEVPAHDHSGDGHRRQGHSHHDDGHHSRHSHHGEPHVHLPLLGGSHDHDHGARTYLKTGLLGALFTLSPPLSMIVFLGTVIPTHGFPVAALAVACYAVGITVTMAALGAGVGGLFGAFEGKGRLFGALRLVAGVAVVALAATMAWSVVSAVL